jgi:hypothetical protein
MPYEDVIRSSAFRQITNEEEDTCHMRMSYGPVRFVRLLILYYTLKAPKI